MAAGMGFLVNYNAGKSTCGFVFAKRNDQLQYQFAVQSEGNCGGFQKQDSGRSADVF
jgi:hypothetical protein